MNCSNLRAPSPQGKTTSVVPFARLPHALASDPRLTPTDVRVLLALLFWARDKPTCWPSDTSIGKRIGRCRATVSRRLAHLEQLGLVRREAVPYSDENRTCRVVHLPWNTHVTPPVTRPRRPPVTPVRHEAPSAQEAEKEKAGGLATQGPPPARKEEPIRGLAALEAHYQGAGWLAYPPGHPLRAMAEGRLAVAAGKAPPRPPVAPRRPGRLPAGPRPEPRT